MVFKDQFINTRPPEYLREARSYAHKQVLIIEQNNRTCNYIRRVLDGCLGCHVDVSTNGNEALAMLESRHYDVLLCEMMLPGLHGLELVSEVRTAFPEIGIIVLSAQKTRFPFVESVRVGASDYIQKPFLPAELEAKIIRIFHEQELRRERFLEERKYRSLFELSIDGMVLLDDSGMLIEDVNPAFQELVGVKKSELVNKPIAVMMDAGDRQRFEQWLSLCKLIGRGAIADLKLIHCQGNPVYVDTSITVVQSDQKTGIFLAFKDVTERREVQIRLAEAAQRDSLTGIFNRRAFSHHIHGAVRAAHENNVPTTLMAIDLDGFKACNDTYGHPTGDQVLIEAATVISMSIRTTAGDACFRYGGDEFAVLLAGADLDEGRRVARRIQNEFSERDAKGVTMSIGLANFRPEYSVEDFIRAADQAMYDAKTTGKNMICESQP